MGVYLMAHAGLNAAKIGVGVARDGHMNRVDVHRRRGWELHASWSGLTEPGIAFDVERAVIVHWRTAGLPAHVPPAEMPQFGSTETVQLDLIDLGSVAAMVEELLGEAASPPAAIVA